MRIFVSARLTLIRLLDAILSAERKPAQKNQFNLSLSCPFFRVISNVLLLTVFLHSGGGIFVRASGVLGLLDVFLLSLFLSGRLLLGRPTCSVGRLRCSLR